MSKPQLDHLTAQGIAFKIVHNIIGQAMMATRYISIAVQRHIAHMLHNILEVFDCTLLLSIAFRAVADGAACLWLPTAAVLAAVRLCLSLPPDTLSI